MNPNQLQKPSLLLATISEHTSKILRLLKERQADLKHLPVSTLAHPPLIALDVEEPIPRLNLFQEGPFLFIGILVT